MEKIISLSHLPSLIKKLRAQDKSIVLVGGVFDILHIGHIKFLKDTKKHGDILMVFLEEDRRIRKSKGPHRPIHTQPERAEMLASLVFVDYILLLSNMKTSADYQKLLKSLSPATVAITEGDQYTNRKKEQAEKVGSKLVVIPKINTPSTTQLAKLLELEQ